MGDDIQQTRDKINRMYERLEEATYYELLDVDQELPEAEVSRQATEAFREMAKEWHVDRYDIEQLGGEEYRTKLQEIFSTVNTAHQVLTSEEKRTEYDMELSGENTDIGAILDAENAFRKGQNMLDSGSYKGAHEQFEQACEMNPDDIEYRAHYLYTEYMLLPKDDEGVPKSRSRAEDIYREMDDILEQKPELDWLLAYLGVVTMGLKRYREAMSLFEEALRYNPKNTTAQRQKRVLKMRAKREENKGFFEKLLDKLPIST